MKRYAHIFFLNVQKIFEHRLRSFIWFLTPLFNAGILILFWSGANKTGTTSGVWPTSQLVTYYLLLTIANSFITSHIEEDISEFDIQQGELARYLIRPISYYWLKFFEEIPYRILQGLYGIALFLGVAFVLKYPVSLSNDLSILILAFISVLIAHLISFAYKVVLGLTSLWFMEIRAFMQLFEIVTIVFGGMIVPLHFFPLWMQNIALTLPFAYIIYFPIIMFQGKLTPIGSLQILGIQAIWLLFFSVLYKIEWSLGIKKFTAVGQ